MSKGTFLFIIGMLLIVVPYLGVPSAWKDYLYVLLGAVILLVGYAIRRTQYFIEIDRGNGERGGDTFVETTQNLFTGTTAE
jgi:hypothetical protein